MDPKFDKEAAYDEHIAPLMTQIIEKATEHGIPMIASFCYRHGHNGDVSSVCTTSLTNGEGWRPFKFKEMHQMLKG